MIALKHIDKRIWYALAAVLIVAAVITAICLFVLGAKGTKPLANVETTGRAGKALIPAVGYDLTKRGYRNNNPLNIRISNNQWQGKITPSADSDFEQFETIIYGFRAAIKNLKSYITRYGCNTISTIISKWAPASDSNNPMRYAAVVSNRSGIDKDEVIQPTDREKICKIIHWMAYFENGSEPLDKDINAAWAIV